MFIKSKILQKITINNRIKDEQCEYIEKFIPKKKIWKTVNGS